MTSTWYDTPALRALQSLGSTAARPGSLAGLADARREHLGQFFSPTPVAQFLWSLMAPAMAHTPAQTGRERITLLDTSCGSGRLLQFADPDVHALFGCDVHGPAIAALIEATGAAGFEGEFVHAGLESVHPRHFDFAILNPPFSLNLSSPLLAPLPGTSWGRFGPHTSALSHEYALEQALVAASNVLAIVPRPFAQLRTARDPERLRAVLHLPAGSFREEGTDVATSVLVYGPVRLPVAPHVHSLRSLTDPVPPLDLSCTAKAGQRARLGAVAVDASQPSITLPVTGDRAVRIVKDGRKLRLRFACGFTQARVMNALLNRPVHAPSDTHRYPQGVRFHGQGWFDLENYLAQDDVLGAYAELQEHIRAAGGAPAPDPAIAHFLRRRDRRHTRQATPFRHVVQGADAPTAGSTHTLTALRNRAFNPKRWGSGQARKGEAFEASFDGRHYRLTHPTTNETLELAPEDAARDFQLPAMPDADGWRDAYPGRIAAFPELARCIRAQLRLRGVDRLSLWDFQADDIVELRMAPGGVAAAKMGCGKSRYALALALAGGDHSLIAVEAHLVEEMIDEVEAVGLEPHEWQVIRHPDQCANLKRVNIISYSRLKREIAPGAGRRTFARLLRRRIGTLIADECHLLRNFESDQARALWQLSPRRKYGLTGTPIPNYARDMLPLAWWAMGEGTRVQPFGRFWPHLEKYNLRCMDHAQKGMHVFQDKHVVTEWVTHQAADSLLQKGGKREIPRVRNLDQLRGWAANLLKRRVTNEPDVAKHFSNPSSEVITHTLDWDRGHLAHYLTLADEFASWFRKARQQADAHGGNVSMITLLARIGAVARAATFPQHAQDGFGSYGPLTSKQRAVLDRGQALAGEGHKVVVYVDQPANVELFVREFADRGLEAVAFHGGLPIRQRTRALNDRFRRGPAPILVATFGCVQTGLNIWQATRGLLACHCWTSKAEDQAMARLLRPQQTQHVVFEQFELAGSLDVYQAQHVSHKRDAANATLDFLEPEFEDVEFLHLDRILDTFVDALSQRAGLPAHDYRKALKDVA